MHAARILLSIYAIAVIAFLLLPVVVVIPMSFNDAMVFEFVPSKLGIDQYVRLFSVRPGSKPLAGHSRSG